MFNARSSRLLRMNLLSLPPKAEPHGRKVILCLWWENLVNIHFKFLNSRLSMQNLILTTVAMCTLKSSKIHQVLHEVIFIFFLYKMF